uniref:Uncharacterized protein n=1 Tax=Romanomermis culicivorax TaxID=13658 RepID=A0A915IQ76_ROMCU
MAKFIQYPHRKIPFVFSIDFSKPGGVRLKCLHFTTTRLTNGDQEDVRLDVVAMVLILNERPILKLLIIHQIT